MILPTLYTVATKLLYSLDIDKLSPDKDEDMVSVALQKTTGMKRKTPHAKLNPASNTIIFL